MELVARIGREQGKLLSVGVDGVDVLVAVTRIAKNDDCVPFLSGKDDGPALRAGQITNRNAVVSPKYFTRYADPLCEYISVFVSCIVPGDDDTAVAIRNQVGKMLLFLCCANWCVLLRFFNPFCRQHLCAQRQNEKRTKQRMIILLDVWA